MSADKPPMVTLCAPCLISAQRFFNASLIPPATVFAWPKNHKCWLCEGRAAQEAVMGLKARENWADHRTKEKSKENLDDARAG